MSELDFEPIKDSKSNFNKVLVRLKKIKIPDLPNDIYIKTLYNILKQIIILKKQIIILKKLTLRIMT